MRPSNTTLETYDSSLIWSIHVVEVTLQDGDYIGTFRYEMRGNVTGWGSIDNAPELLREEWRIRHDRGETTEGVVVEDESEFITLTNAQGDTLGVEIWGDGELECMVTAVRIVEVKPYDPYDREVGS